MEQISFVYREIKGKAIDLLAGTTRSVTYDLSGIFVCKDGSLDLKVDGVNYFVEKGTLCLYASKSVLEAKHFTHNLDGVLIGAPLEQLLPSINQALGAENSLSLRQNPCIQLNEMQMKRVLELIRLVKNHHQEYSECVDQGSSLRYVVRVEMEHLIKALIFEVVRVFMECVPLKPTKRSRKDELVQKFLVLMHEHYRQHHELAFYAEQSCVSVRYLSSVIKQKTGFLPVELIYRLLMTDAVQMLENTTMPVKEISDRLGFSSQSLFGRYFKKQHGVSPYYYRNRGK